MTNVTQNLESFLCDFEKYLFKIKTTVVTFWQLMKKLGYFFLISGNTA